MDKDFQPDDDGFKLLLRIMESSDSNFDVIFENWVTFHVYDLLCVKK